MPPSDIRLLSKGGVSMKPGKRFGLSAIEKSDDLEAMEGRRDAA
jgi:hypothetical protein